MFEDYLVPSLLLGRVVLALMLAFGTLASLGCDFGSSCWGEESCATLVLHLFASTSWFLNARKARVVPADGGAGGKAGGR